MSYYLYQGTYTAEAWAAMIKKPSNVIERTRPLIEAMGGQVVGAWYAFGEYDIVMILEFPDNISVAAAVITAAAGGAGTAAKTTPLLTPEEGIEVMKKAGSLPYARPGS